MGYKEIKLKILTHGRHRFYLNHMGYKGEGCRLLDWCGVWFYLNHMGYKVVSFWGVSMNFLSFIWTIWDIKIVLEKGYSYDFEFYLNHMGYKVCLWGFWWCCFFWFYLNHMGYKDLTLKGGDKNDESFIWTIWDIKDEFDGLNLLRQVVLSEPYGI